jgi:hypothetical protein
MLQIMKCVINNQIYVNKRYCNVLIIIKKTYIGNNCLTFTALLKNSAARGRSKCEAACDAPLARA